MATEPGKTTSSEETGKTADTVGRVDPRKSRHPLEQDDVALNGAGQALLASIDESARPNALAAQFPRIINRMAKVWKAPSKMDRCFEDLLTDTRGNRQGFPLRVLTELSALKDYYRSKVFPARGDVRDAELKPTGR